MSLETKIICIGNYTFCITPDVQDEFDDEIYIHYKVTSDLLNMNQSDVVWKILARVFEQSLCSFADAGYDIKDPSFLKIMENYLWRICDIDTNVFPKNKELPFPVDQAIDIKYVEGEN